MASVPSESYIRITKKKKKTEINAEIGKPEVSLNIDLNMQQLEINLVL